MLLGDGTLQSINNACVTVSLDVGTPASPGAATSTLLSVPERAPDAVLLSKLLPANA